MLNKLALTAAFVLALGAGPVFALESVHHTAAATHGAARGGSAFSRNVGPASTVTGTPRNVMGSVNSGIVNHPYAPSAGSVGGN